MRQGKRAIAAICCFLCFMAGPLHIMLPFPAGRFLFGNFLPFFLFSSSRSLALDPSAAHWLPLVARNNLPHFQSRSLTDSTFQ